MENSVMSWLLESSNPAVRYRTLTELLDNGDQDDVTAALNNLLSSEDVKHAFSLFEIGKAYADAHAFSTLAECGLTRKDLDIDRYVENYISGYGFADGCGEGFLLRNLVKLGYCDMPEVRKELSRVLPTRQIDGGYPCVSKNLKIKKPNMPHKSCFQMSVSFLLLMAELRRSGHKCDEESELAEYFLGRDVLFRHDDPNRLVKEEMGRTFHPPVATRIGLHMILYSLSVLGKADDPRCKRAWDILEQRRAENGKYVVDCSLAKPYIKTEKPQKPSKWVTFYVLASKRADGKC